MKSYITLLLFISISASIIAQSTQNIKGIITDKQSEMPLIGASVSIPDTDPMIGTLTEMDGDFILENVPLGRYNLEISYLGYKTITIPNVEITAGKEVFLEIGIEESIELLNEVVVTAEVEKDKAQNELATVSARTFSVDEVNRYAGGRSDIGRLVANFAGVSTADDARNDIVIRGNSPTGVLWRMEGIPIPNPNHFSTSGSTGGPVSALNPNMIKNSDFMTSAFPAEYGNALAGVFDLGLRTGNRDKHEFMLQMGAISGLEMMAEGPISKKNNSSYLVAARYSFVGIPTALGIPIGTNATPNYQDVAFNLNLGKSKIGKFSLFGVAGKSSIDFLHDEVEDGDFFATNGEDSYARSSFGVLGLKHNIILNKTTYLRTVVSASMDGNSFDLDRIDSLGTANESATRILEVDDQQFRFSLSSFVNKKFNSKMTMRAGILLESFQYDLNNRTRQYTPNWIDIYQFNDNSLLTQAYIQTQYKINKSFTLNTGLHAQILSLNKDWAIEPRFALNYHINEKHTINIGYGLHSQTAPLPILLTKEQMPDGQYEETNIDLNASRSQHFVLGYDTKLGTDWRIKTEAYFQYMNKVPVDPYASSFSLLNLGEGFGFPDDKTSLVNEGTGVNYGIELTLEKFFSKGYYGLLTTSIYDSSYKGSDGIRRSSAFNNQYVFNILAGKEVKIGKEKRNALTFDTKLTTAGGRHYTPIDFAASEAAGEQILETENAYSEQYSPYFRWDVKFGIKLNSKKRKLSQHFYFDIQNVTNNKNLFAKRYDKLTNEVKDIYQLGFFPDFMYRLTF